MRAMPTPRPMAPHDLTRVRFVSDPLISPDGATVAFVVTTLSEERDEYLSAIWLGDVRGGAAGAVAAAPGARHAPALVARRLAPGLRLRARSQEEGPALRDAGPGWRADAPHRPSPRGERAAMVARRHTSGLRGAGGRLAGARVRRGESQVAAAAGHHHAQVPVQR